MLRLEHRRTVVGDELVVKTQIRIDVETLHRNLKQMFGFDDFRPGQLEVIESIARGEDVLSVMPTGSGKSLATNYLLRPVLLERSWFHPSSH